MPSPAICFNRRISHFEELPSIIAVEPYVGCNLKCKMCSLPSAYGKTLTVQKIDMRLYRKLIDACSGSARTIVLTGRGEPLLNPDLSELVDVAAKHHHFPGIFSNGTLMNEEKVHQLLQAGLSWIFFSVDGITAETFENLRTGAKFDSVISNILQMAKINKMDYGGKCAIMINCVLSKESLKEKKMIIDFWNKHGIALRFSPLREIHYTKGFVVPQSMNAKRHVSRGKEGRYPCNFLWLRFNVSVDGRYKCCFYEDPFQELPSINDVDVREFWREHLGKLREQHICGKITSPECASCAWWRERSEYISLFERQRINFVNKGYIRMDRLLRIWNALTEYKPIATT